MAVQTPAAAATVRPAAVTTTPVQTPAAVTTTPVRTHVRRVRVRRLVRRVRVRRLVRRLVRRAVCPVRKVRWVR